MQIAGPHDLTHQALLYDSREGLVAGALPILRDGLRRDEEVVVISSPASVAAIKEALPAREAATITFEPSHHRYRRAAHALTGFQDMLAARAREGTPVRLLAEQPLTVMPPDQLEELCRCDAAFNEVSCAEGATVVCAYDRRNISPRVAGMVLRSHPEVIEDGVCRANPAYTEPRAVLAQEYRGPPLPVPPAGAAELSCPRDTAEAREFVAGTAACHGLAEPELGPFVTAVNEVVSNAMVHAVLDTVLVWREADRVVCEVRDYGFGLGDPLAGYRVPGPAWTSGRGLWLARQLADLVEVRSGLDGTTLRLHARIGGEAPG